MRLGFYTTAVIAPAMSLFWNYMYGHLNPRFDTVTWCVCAAILMVRNLSFIVNYPTIRKAQLKLLSANQSLT